MSLILTIVLIIVGFRHVQCASNFQTESDIHVDLGFAVDRHESIDNGLWTTMLEFVANFSSQVRIEETGSRVGLVSFDEISTLDIKLNDHNTTTELQSDIRSQLHGGHGRDISLGIYRLRADLFTEQSGDSLNGNVGVLITNGASKYENAVHEAELLRNNGATLISVGVGADVNVPLLVNISDGPGNVLTVDAFQDLHTLTVPLRNLIDEAVGVPVTPVTPTTTPTFPTTTNTTTTTTTTTTTPIHTPSRPPGSSPVPVLPPEDFIADIGYAIDRHQSVDEEEWRLMLEFIAEFSNYIRMDHDSRTGLVSFDKRSTLDIKLNEHNDVEDIQVDIMSQPHGGQGRDISQGLYTLREGLFQEHNGDQSEVNNVAVLITNGDSDYEHASKEGQLLRNTGAILISIGVGYNVSMPWLVDISGDEENVLWTPHFSTLSTLIVPLQLLLYEVVVDDDATVDYETTPLLLAISITCALLTITLVAVVIWFAVRYRRKTTQRRSNAACVDTSTQKVNSVSGVISSDCDVPPAYATIRNSVVYDSYQDAYEMPVEHYEPLCPGHLKFGQEYVNVGCNGGFHDVASDDKYDTIPKHIENNDMADEIHGVPLQTGSSVPGNE